MSVEGGSGEQLAQWLKEAGRRAPAKAAPVDENADDTYNSPASLHHYLESLAGRKLQSHAEVLAYLGEVAGTQPDAYRERERRRRVRELSLVAFLAISYYQYYFLDVQLQISQLRSVGVFVTVPAPQPSRQS